MSDGIVWFDDSGRPFLENNNWLHYWNDNTKTFITSRPLQGIEFFPRRASIDEAAKYGIKQIEEK